jgi:hypothetical protein
MIPDYNIDDPKYQGRTRIPENGIAKARPSDLKLLLGNAPPESDTPIGSLAHSFRRLAKQCQLQLHYLLPAPTNMTSTTDESS